MLVITGEGKAFVAGADIAECIRWMKERLRVGQLGQGVPQDRDAEKPVIAAVNGYALGAAASWPWLAISALQGQGEFGQPEVGLGITPGYSGTRLPQLVGKAKAMELILTGEIIDADEAAAIGLVNKVVPQESLLDEAFALAEKIAKNAPIAVAYSKEAIVKGLECSNMDEAIEVEAKLFGKCFSTEDQKEGMGAFLEKRKPVFKGK